MRRAFIGASMALASHTLADPDAHLEKVLSKAFMPAAAPTQRVGHMAVHLGASVAPADRAPITKLPVNIPENSFSNLRREISKLEETSDRMKAELEDFRSRITTMEGPQAPTKSTDTQNGRNMMFGFGCLGYGVSATLLVSITYRLFVKATCRAPVASMKLLDCAEVQSSAATAHPLICSIGGLRGAETVMSESKGCGGHEAMHDPEPTEAGNRTGDVKMAMSPSRAGDVVRPCLGCDSADAQFSRRRVLEFVPFIAVSAAAPLPAIALDEDACANENLALFKNQAYGYCDRQRPRVKIDVIKEKLATARQLRTNVRESAKTLRLFKKKPDAESYKSVARIVRDGQAQVLSPMQDAITAFVADTFLSDVDKKKQLDLQPQVMKGHMSELAYYLSKADFDEYTSKTGDTYLAGKVERELEEMCDTASDIILLAEGKAAPVRED